MQKPEDEDDNTGSRHREAVSLLDVVLLIGTQKWLFLGITIVGTAGFLALALLMPRYYVASTLVLTPQQPQSGASMLLAQLGPLANMAGVAGGKAPDEMYVALLKVKKVKSAIVEKHRLVERYQATSPLVAEEILSSRSSFGSDKKTGLISISVDDESPSEAASIANAYVEELRKLLSDLAVTEAQQRRVFLDKQVSQRMEEVLAAERKFRQDLSTSGMSLTDVVADSTLKAGIELRAQIAALEVKLQTLRQFATSQNPDVQRVLAELGALRQQLSKVESGGKKPENEGDGAGPSNLAAASSYRDYKVKQAALDALVQQLELTKIDVAKEGPLLQQVDVAQPPERATKPSRLLIVVVGFMASFALGAVVALMKAGVQNANAATKEKMRALKTVWL
jgi:uncharacterized protein involved in exopolysaccharide biosynthesis